MLHINNMGNTSSNNNIIPVNYQCPTCMGKKANVIPNMAGRFFIINDKECQCNGCKTIYPKEQFYKPVINDARLA